VVVPRDVHRSARFAMFTGRFEIVPRLSVSRLRREVLGHVSTSEEPDIWTSRPSEQSGHPTSSESNGP
jgi:hypothetical protein